ncbi:DUF3298 and DUF4163 domain-containing protein [Pontibacter oryzae]|uniref:DUF3298/DUF4163 domain-containing protein n=1 Tax=Pontibacter oryzae TaxID=2304593 RepID=A0A399SEC5_9BACT|nr:DUF3298 and DUF4163 domain-containing protein [Pontibacter oryzae]RIJ42010.1 DUF3298/DUF4163 domain-containing protein [Pontibacter oryzae]
MLKHIFRTFLISSICLSACQSNTDEKKEAEEPVKPLSLSFHTETVTKKSSLCGTNDAGCATATVSYLQAQNGSRQLRDSINSFIQNHLLQLQLDHNPDKSIKPESNPAATLAVEFIRDQEEFVSSLGAVPPTSAWYLQVSASPIYESPSITTLQLESSSYTGGAHGNSYITLQSFDKDGHNLRIRDMITDTTKLSLLAGDALLKQDNFKGTTSIKEAGLFIDGDRLPLPQQAALTSKGLLLLYNSYEIGPYALGQIRIELPYPQLEGIIVPKYKP